MLPMAAASELLTCLNSLAASAEALATELRREENGASESFNLAGPTGESTLDRARRALLTNAVAIQAMLNRPNDFVRGLAVHVRILSLIIFPESPLRPSS